MTTAVVEASRASLARHARSFRWASWFLPPDRRDDAAVVYAFCRLVDDLADEAPDPVEARVALDRLEAEVRGEAAARPLVAAFREVFARRGGGVQPAVELIAGVRGDLGPVCVQGDAGLLRYGYRVAGTVSLMMCAVLGVTDPRAMPFAIDLGVAMQITNICRDVREDAERCRVYLPADRLRGAGTSPEALLAGDAPRAAVAPVVGDLLGLADRYYQSARAGMRWIPLRSRLAILVAARVYRGIGVVLRAAGCDALRGRVHVGVAGKAAWSLVALGDLLRLAAARPAEHDVLLHTALRDLPGAHA